MDNFNLAKDTKMSVPFYIKGTWQDEKLGKEEVEMINLTQSLKRKKLK
jgi:hypothetical protein